MSDSDDELPTLHSVLYGSKPAPAAAPRAAPAPAARAAPQQPAAAEAIDLTLSDSDAAPVQALSLAQQRMWPRARLASRRLNSAPPRYRSR
jgi:hypothetical protein